MAQPIGIRVPDDILKKIDDISKQEHNDRSTIIRKLILIGFAYLMKQTAAEEYKKGNITISEAAKQADLTIWEMEKFLIEEGYKSEYSIEDLDEEKRLLGI